MDLKETDILGDDIGQHWYYAAKARAMRDYLRDRQFHGVLDVGAGSAFFSRQLLESGVCQEAWCVDISYPSDSDFVHAGRRMHLRRSLEDSEADLVLLMDVLEHVDEDVQFLASYAAKVRSGTAFFISVPAFQFLWSGHDEFLGHRRRYTLAGVEHMVTKAGLRVLRSSYCFGTVFPLAVLTRLGQRLLPGPREARSELKRHHPLTNTLLGLACTLERPVLRLNKVAGLSVFCLAEKP